MNIVMVPGRRSPALERHTGQSARAAPNNHDLDTFGQAFPGPRWRTTTYELRARACVNVLHFSNYILMILISRSAGRPPTTCPFCQLEIVSVTLVLIKLRSSLYAANANRTAVGSKCEIVTSN